MNWPMSHEFNEAIQNANLVFSDPDLRTGEVVVGARGLPLPRSGNFADVYQLRGADGRDWAVKCFTRPVTGLGDRYAAISETLARASLPFTVGFKYLAEGIRIGGAWWPVVKMEWVEGLLLNQVIREKADRPKILAALGQMWGRLCLSLRDNRIAHADLQHGNVLMVPGSRPGAYGLKLIDYDGMHVPALANHPSGESGHPAYQHPRRSGAGGYSPDVDRFPHLLIASALKGLEVGGPALWERYDTGDNLLFVESDFQNPAASKLMRELWQTEHPGVQALVGRLALASQRPIPQTPWLDQIAPEGEPDPLDEDTRREAIRTLGLSSPVAMLPPEPSPEPISWGDIVEQPPALVLPPTLPSGLVSKSVPSTKQAASPAKENDVRPVEESSRGKGPKRKPLDQEEPRTSNTRLLAISGVLLLVVGGGVAGVVMSGGKPKPLQTVEIESEVPNDPEPKDHSQKGGTPKGTNTDPVRPSPKDKNPDPIVPVEPIATPRAPEAIRVSIKELKRIPLGQAPHFAAEFNNDGAQLVVMGQHQSIISYDVRTGEARPLPDFPKGDGRGNIHLFIVGTRTAVWRRGENSFAVSDLGTGLAAGTVAFTDLPLPPGIDSDAIIAISPDGRYVAAGRRSPRATRTGTQEKINLPVPFRLVGTTTGKQILSFDWTNGLAHFTADSSRVLVVEGSGRGRWFKLPSGEPDGEWKFGEQTAGMPPMVVEAASGDGQRLLCFGTAQGQPMTQFLLDGYTGRVSSVLGQGFNSTSGRLSADGRLAALLQQKPSPPETWMIVFDTARGAEVARVKVNNTIGIFPVLALTSDGRRAAAVSRLNGEATIYDLVRSKEPDEVIVKPKEPPPPSEPVDLKPRWTSGVAALPGLRIYFDSRTNLLVLGSNEGAIALDVRFGVPRKEFSTLTTGKTHSLFPLEHERFGTIASKWDDIEIWDSKTGKLSERLSIPTIPAGPANAAGLHVALSQNKKYVAIGRVGMPSTDYPDMPFRVVEAATRKVLVSVDWRGGSAHFTTDSSRVLVAEWTGRARWFKLPSGEEDGGWDFGPPQVGRINTVHAISADGSLVAYTGPGIGKTKAAMPGVIDGKTGRAVRAFTKDYHDSSAIALSENGRRVAVLRAFKPDGNEFVRSIDAIDVRTGVVFNRARIESGTSIPTFDLTPDGKALVVHDAAVHKAYFFDLVDP